MILTRLNRWKREAGHLHSVTPCTWLQFLDCFQRFTCLAPFLAHVTSVTVFRALVVKFFVLTDVCDCVTRINLHWNLRRLDVVSPQRNIPVRRKNEQLNCIMATTISSLYFLKHSRFLRSMYVRVVFACLHTQNVCPDGFRNLELDSPHVLHKLMYITQ
jgi:hypothetical protein